MCVHCQPLFLIWQFAAFICVEDGKTLSQSEFRHLLKRALEAAGLKTNQYSSHGLCIGAAIFQVSKTI